MEQLELELLAKDVRHRARVRDDEVLVAPRIAMRLLGHGSVRVVPRLSTRACLAVIDGRDRIFLRSDSPDPNFDVAHELGHWALRRVANYVGADEESLANRVAAAILAPPDAVHRAYEAIGEAPAPLSKCFGITQTAITLRLAEVRHEERAIVTKNENVIVRTQGLFSWMPESARVWARGRVPSGVRKLRLTGSFDGGRVALRAG